MASKSITIRGRVVIDSRRLKSDLAKVRTMVKKTVDDLNKSSSVSPTINAKIKVDKTALKGVGKQAAKSVEAEFSKAFANSVKSFKRDLLAVAAVGTAAFAGVGTILGKGIKTNLDFSKSIQTVKALSDEGEASKEAIAGMVSAINDTAKATPQSMDSLGKAAVNLRRAGFSIIEMQDGLIQKSGQLATAVGIDIDKSSAVVANAVKLFKLEPGEGVEIGLNRLVLAANNANQTILDVKAAMTALKGANVDDLGFSVLSKALADIGIVGSAQGTAIKQYMAGFEKNADKLNDMYGIQVYNADESRKSTIELMDAMRDRGQLMTDSEQAELLPIFGERGIAGFRAAIAMSDEEYQSFKARVKATNGEMENAQEIMMSGLTGSAERFKSTKDVLMNSIGSGMSDVVQAAATIGADFMDALMGDLSADNVYELTANIQSAFEPILEMFGSFEDVEGTADKIFKVNEETKAGIQTIVSNILGFIQNIPAYIEAAKTSITEVLLLFGNVGEKISFIYGILQSIVSTVSMFIAENLGGIVTVLTAIFTTLAVKAAIIAAPIIAMKLAIAGVVLLVGNLIQRLATGKTEMLNLSQSSARIKEQFVGIIQRAKELWATTQQLRADIGAMASGALSKFANLIRTIWERTAGVRKQFVSLVSEGIKRAVGAMTLLVAKAKQFWQNTKGIRTALATIAGFVLVKIKQFFVEYVRFLGTILGHIFKTVRQSKALQIVFGRIRAFAGLIGKAVQGIANWIGKSQGNAAKTNNQFKIFRGLANVVKGIITVIAKVIDAIFIVMDKIQKVGFGILRLLVTGWMVQFKLVKAIITFIKDTFAKILEFLGGIVGDMKKFVTENENVKAAVDMVAGAFSGVKETLGGLISKTMEWITNLDGVKAAIGGIKGAMEAGKNFLGGAAGAVMGLLKGKGIKADQLSAGGDDSFLMRAMGLTEGNRTLDGGKTSTYASHWDPVGQKYGAGSVSDIHGRSPEEAAKHWNKVLSDAITANLGKMEAAGLGGDMQIAMNIADMRVQSPLALEANGGFLDKLPALGEALKNVSGLAQRQEIINEFRKESYRDPNSGNLQTSFNSEADLLHDQTRRGNALVEFLNTYKDEALQAITEPIAQAVGGGGGGGFASPLSGVTIEQLDAYDTASFQKYDAWRSSRNGAHAGVDYDYRIAGGDGYTEGKNVAAMFQGVVKDVYSIGTNRRTGEASMAVLVEGIDAAGKRIESVYNHLSSDVKVSKGQAVSAGQILGNVGGEDTLSRGAHLDLKVKVNGSYVDPEEFIQLRGAAGALKTIDLQGNKGTTQFGGIGSMETASPVGPARPAGPVDSRPAPAQAAAETTPTTTPTPTPEKKEEEKDSQESIRQAYVTWAGTEDNKTKNAVSTQTDELKDELKELRDSLADEEAGVDGKTDASKVAELTKKIGDKEEELKNRPKILNKENQLNKALERQRLGLGDQEGLNEDITKYQDELRELGVEEAKIKRRNAAIYKREAKEALDEKAQAEFDSWKTSQDQILEQKKQQIESDSDSEIDTVNQKIAEEQAKPEDQRSQTALSLLELEREGLEVQKEVNLALADEEQSLAELNKYKELGVKLDEGYNLDLVIANQERLIAEKKVNVAVEERQGLLVKEAEVYNNLIARSNELQKNIGERVGTAIQLPKSTGQETQTAIEKTKEELSKTIEEFERLNADIDTKLAYLEGKDDEVSVERRGELQRERAENVEGIDNAANIAQAKTLFVQKKQELQQRRELMAEEKALMETQNQVDNINASKLEAFGLTHKAEEIRMLQQKALIEQAYKEKMIELDEKLLLLRTQLSELEPGSEEYARVEQSIQQTEQRVQAETDLRDAKQSTNEEATSTRAQMAQVMAKTAINDLSQGIHDMIMNSKSLGEVFTGMLKNMASQLIKMAAQKLLQKALGGFLSGGNFNKGGMVSANFNSGGYVPYQPGTTRANKDTIPAWLTQGEGVLTRGEVKAMGGQRGFENFRKSLKSYRNFNSGGYVSNRVSAPVSTSNMQGRQSVNYTFETQRVGNMDVVDANQIKQLEQRLNGRIEQSTSEVREGMVDGFRSSNAFRDGIGVGDV